MTTQIAQIPRHQIPSIEDLTSKIVRMTKLSYEEVYVKYGTRVPNQRGTYEFSTNPVVIEAWAHLIINTSITFGEVINGMHVVPMPTIEREKRRPQAYAAFRLFGVDIDEWDSWMGPYFSIATPCYVYRYHRLCARYGIDSINSDEYYDYLKEIGADDQVPVKKMTKWIQIAADLHSTGIDRRDIYKFSMWVAQDWTWEAIARLTRAGVTVVQAQEAWDAGIEDSVLIQQHLIDGLPLDWALNILNARSANGDDSE